KQQRSDIEKEFWNWFIQRSDEYFRFEENQESLFDDLAGALAKVHPDLCFEFGPVENGKRDFVISAGGIKDSFGAVISLCNVAPPLPQWNLIEFRPRRDPEYGLEINGIKIEANDIWFALEPHDNKVGVILFMPDIQAEE